MKKFIKHLNSKEWVQLKSVTVTGYPSKFKCQRMFVNSIMGHARALNWVLTTFMIYDLYAQNGNVTFPIGIVRVFLFVIFNVVVLV